jgi:hypothetical protein
LPDQLEDPCRLLQRIGIKGLGGVPLETVLVSQLACADGVGVQIRGHAVSMRFGSAGLAAAVLTTRLSRPPDAAAATRRGDMSDF